MGLALGAFHFRSTRFQDSEDRVQQVHIQIKVKVIDRWIIARVAERNMARAGREMPVYISIDIDILGEAFAPATGTPEAGD